MLLMLCVICQVFGASLVTEKTLHFVGGTGTQAGDAGAGGGCTLASYSGDYTDYMGTNGACLVNETDATLTDNGSGKVRISDASITAITAPVGILLRLDSDGTHADGVYKVTASGAGYCDIDLTYAGDESPATEVWIGGAFPDVQTALTDGSTDVATASAYYDRYICTNVDETLASSVDTIAGGHVASSRFLCLIGFDDLLTVTNGVVVSDMDSDGDEYRGAFEALRIERSMTERQSSRRGWVLLDADDGAFDVIDLGGSNIELRNFKIFNTNEAAGNDAFVATDGVVTNISVVNCYIATVDDIFSGGNASSYGIWQDCYVGAGTGNTNNIDTLYYTTFVGCVFDGTNLSYGLGSPYICSIYNCLFYDGDFGLGMSFATSVQNSIFYGQISGCIRMNFSTNSIKFNNCILSPNGLTDYAAYISTSGGEILPASYHNNVYSVQGGGAVTGAGNGMFYTNVTGLAHRIYLPVTELNPYFKDPANGDFTIQNNTLIQAGIGFPQYGSGSSGGVIFGDLNRSLYGN